MDVIEPEVKEPPKSKASSFFADVGGDSSSSSSSTAGASSSETGESQMLKLCGKGLVSRTAIREGSADLRTKRGLLLHFDAMAK